MKDLGVKVMYPSGGMEKVPDDHDVVQPPALGEIPMGKMGADGDNPSISEGTSAFGQGQGIPKRSSPSSDPYPAKPGC